jgi:hypothetical protein
VSPPTAVARTVSTPEVLMVAPATVSRRSSRPARLAGQHRLVDGGGAVDDLAVDRDLLAGADPQEVADHDLLDRDLDLGAVPDDAGGLGPELEQRTHRRAGAALRAGLEVPAEHEEGDDQRGGLEVVLVLARRSSHHE